MKIACLLASYVPTKTMMIYTKPDLDELTRRMEEAEVKVNA